MPSDVPPRPPPPASPPSLPQSAIAPPPPGIGKAALLCCVFYGFAIFGEIVNESLAATTGIKAQPVVSLFFELLLAWPLTLWISAKLTNRSWKSFYVFRAFPKTYCIPLILAGFGFSIVLTAAGTLIPMPEFFEELFLSLMRGNRFFVLLTVCLVAPIMEELFFRGFVFREFLKRYSMRKAMIASSLVFALFHLNPWQAITALPIGLLNAWLVLRTGSVVPGILVHVATNTTSVFLLFALGALFGFSEEELIEQEHVPWQILLVGVVSSVSGLLWLFKLQTGKRRCARAHIRRSRLGSPTHQVMDGQ
jgi:membrane protease YdiL (CAAX protease family)